MFSILCFLRSSLSLSLWAPDLDVKEPLAIAILKLNFPREDTRSSYTPVAPSYMERHLEPISLLETISHFFFVHPVVQSYMEQRSDHISLLETISHFKRRTFKFILHHKSSPSDPSPGSLYTNNWKCQSSSEKIFYTLPLFSISKIVTSHAGPAKRRSASLLVDSILVSRY